MSTPSDRPVALVTGAARRIGRAIALELARAGHDVAVHCHRSRDDAESLVREIVEIGAHAEVFVADLAHAASTRALAAQVLAAMGRVDVLVNNASAFHATPLADTTPEALEAELRDFVAVHIEAPLLLIRALLPGMRQRGSGVVVNLGDADTARPGFAPYVASKAGLRALTRSLARELAPQVRVNMVEPGAILIADGAAPDAAARLIEQIPLGRLGTVHEIARTVRFLVTGPAFVTGQVIAVDGGRHV